MTKQIMDRPVTTGTGSIGSHDGVDDPPRANCGCPTYWDFALRERLGKWEAKHEIGCARRPIRRREAILATKEKNQCTTSD